MKALLQIQKKKDEMKSQSSWGKKVIRKYLREPGWWNALSVRLLVLA